MPKPLNSTATYMKNLFQDSLLTGVPQIVQTRNVPRKVLKTVILLACIIGFVYQTTEFMKIFYSYPTVMDIDVEYPSIIESPAITFCNLNGLKRMPFCNKYPDKCSTPDDLVEFCKAFPKICEEDEENLIFPVDEALQAEELSSPEELKEMGHQSKPLLGHCKVRPVDNYEYQDCNRDEELYLPVNDRNTGFKNCYTLFSNVNSSTLNRYKLPVTKTKEPLFHMAFNLEPSEYFRPDREVGAVVAIHSSNTMINPFFGGFVIKPGYLYTVYLKVVEEKLLPSPYDTRCKDYKEVWVSRGGKGPLNQDVCVAECIFNASIHDCKCVQRSLLYPHNERICDEEDLDCVGTRNISKCYEDCPQPCDFTDFEFDVMERKLEDPHVQNISDFYSKDSITRNHAVVLVFLKRPEKVVYSHRPQYEVFRKHQTIIINAWSLLFTTVTLVGDAEVQFGNLLGWSGVLEDIEVFSFLGGYVGMWLGISLVAVFDFLESVVLIVAYWIRRRAASSTPVSAE